MSLGSTQKGKIVEMLIASTCILGSDGKLSVSVPLIDDEGVDLIFTPKGGGKSIFVQVKSCFTLDKKGIYKTQIRKKTFLSSGDRYIIFAYYDQREARMGDILWFIPATDFENSLKGQKRDDKFIFHSRFSSRNDMWVNYKLQIKDLPKRILDTCQ